jgi:deazaflavin-dependent oxidoreductase (nitroreductase family)
MATEPDLSTPPRYIHPAEWPVMLDHRRRYLATDGADGHYLDGFPTLMLTTTGRRTGLPRTTGLIYGRDEDRLLLVASLHGAPVPPQWYLNLTADPHVQVQLLADRFAAVARTATAEERPRLWEIMTTVNPGYVRYDDHSPRTLQVVILERVAPA